LTSKITINFIQPTYLVPCRRVAAMSKFSIEEPDYRLFLNNAWKVKYEIEKTLPKDIVDWVKYLSTVLGVPYTYIIWPLLVATSYSAQHSFVCAEDIHREPILLYALVAGRSGKSIAIPFIPNLLYL